MEYRLRAATDADCTEIRLMYERVASREGGLARKKNEITSEYVKHFVAESGRSGVIIVAVDSSTGKIVGEIHCYSRMIEVFKHVLGELTIAVDPNYQNQGIGRLLFERLLDIVEREKPKIERVELIARESNVKAIKFYESLGFKVEGRFEKRIHNGDGNYEADIPMAWLRSENR
jgi:ribosomal protein S18 acetylase RimI-like enzyme